MSEALEKARAAQHAFVFNALDPSNSTLVQISTTISRLLVKVQNYINIQEPCSCPTMTPGMCLAVGPGIFCVNGFPCLRPSMLVSRKNTFIGKVDNPFRICGRGGQFCAWDSLDVKDPHGNVRYMISASCCQTAQCLRQMIFILQTWLSMFQTMCWKRNPLQNSRCEWC